MPSVVVTIPTLLGGKLFRRVFDPLAGGASGILLVDEVLAAGDTPFQARRIVRIREL